jgi:hypothetical protein
MRHAFDAYWRHCGSSDYLQPLSESCVNSSGLSLTTLESLEALYLADLRPQFLDARRFVLSSFQCGGDGDWVNVNELGTRAIGALLGIFGLTNDIEFLRRALECGETLLGAFRGPIPHPILDRAVGREYGFMRGTFLSESSGFLLEFQALSRLTGAKRFAGAVKDYLNCVASHSPILSAVWAPGKCQTIGNHSGLSPYTASFAANVMRLHLFEPSPLTSDILNRLVDLFEKAPVGELCSLSWLITQMNDQRFDQVGKRIEKECGRRSSGFVFEASSILKAIVQGSRIENVPDFGYWGQTDCGVAQCSIANENGSVHENLQPSDAIGQWLKFLLLANGTIPVDRFVLNEHGHFIPRQFWI